MQIPLAALNQTQAPRSSASSKGEVAFGIVDVPMAKKIRIVETRRAVRRKVTQEQWRSLANGESTAGLYIGREGRDGVPRSRWANPFQVTAEVNNEKAVALQHPGELRGKVLLCHCRPCEVCHGDFLAEAVNRAEEEVENPFENHGAMEEDGLADRITGREETFLEVAFANSSGWRGVGPPRMASLYGRTKPFSDGGGLCSRSRWAPEARQHPHGVNDESCVELMAVLDEEVRRLGQSGVADLVVHIAAGRISGIPLVGGYDDEGAGNLLLEAASW